MGDFFNRIELKLKSEKTKPLSGWQLQEFMYNINKGYSKLDLINEISMLINEGVEPENIIIINKSYDINNSYNYLHKDSKYDLKKVNLVEKFYNLGKPTSMFPNKKIKEIELIFTLYENLYTIFRASKIPIISKKELKKYLSLSFNEALKEVKSDGMKNISSLEYLRKNKFLDISHKLDKCIERTKISYENYVKDEESINNFKSIINKEFIELNDDEKELYRSMDQKYYNHFYKYFRSIDRPIVLKYDELENELSVIKKEYMINDVESENFLDFKDYSHNSPFVITIIAGISIASIAALLYQGSKQEKFNIEQMKKNEQLEDEIDNDIKDTINYLANSPELNYVNSIENKFVKNKLTDLNDKIKKNTLAALKDKEVINKEIIINFDENRRGKKFRKDNNVLK